MRNVPITELRQRVADVVQSVTEDEPTAILQRSRTAAYLVHPARYDRDQAELRALRRALFLSEVREAEAEYRSGSARRFEDIEDLIDSIRS